MFTRRTCVQGLVAGAATFSMLKPNGVRAAMAGFESPEDRLRALMLLRASLDDRVTIEWLVGRVYGVVDVERTELFSVNAVAFATYTRTSPQIFAGRRVEVVYYGDLQTGAKLDVFRNPYTNADFPIPPQRTPPAGFEIGVAGLSLPAQFGPMRVTTESSIAAPEVHAGKIWMRMDTRNVFKMPGDSPGSRYAESMVYSGALGDVADAEAVYVPANISYSNVVSWRPWMGVIDPSGHTVSHCNGGKVDSLADVPATLRSFVEAEYPDLAADPAAVLAPPESAGG
jgi:hypothetical protein